MFRILCLTLGYFIGCIQSAYLLGKIVYKVDIRKEGSGNAGSTNILRTFGKKSALIVFISDFTKGIFSFLICSYIVQKFGIFNNTDAPLAGFYAGVGAILGHNFPFYMKFKGGKGVATLLGLIFIVNYKIALICYAIGIVTVFFHKFISLASLIIATLFPILLFVFKVELESIIIAMFLTVMTCYKHQENIKRLLNGTERKFTGGKHE
jgi:acyl phosphate:glycerol-3-phosphate acyltransferase